MRTAILVVLTGAVALSAQQAQQAPVFRTGVQLVTVDVVVTDANDKPVMNLTQADFEIIDRGRLQAITNFRFLNIPLSSASTAELRALPPPPDVATNVSPSPDSRLFVVIIDTLHTLESEIVPMKQVMTEFVRTISPDDEVAIIYPNRSDLGTNFTSDRSRMLKAIDDVRAASGFAVDALGRPVAALGRREGVRHGIALAFSLKQAARALAGSGHPRRAIVLMGAGTPANMSGDAGTQWNVFDEFKDVYQTARESNVPIYTIDPRGMVVLADAIRGGIGRIGGLDDGASSVAFGLNHQKNNLHVAAANTGGRSFVDQSSITGAMRALVADNSSVYLLSYYPDTAPLTDRFNQIEVKVKRPGLKVRARTGYHAATGMATTTPVDARLAGAMTSALDVRGLALRASVSPLLPTRDTVRTAVTVHVTYPTDLVPNRPTDALRVQLLALDGDAKVKATVERSYTVRLPDRAQAEAGIVINDVIDLPSQPLTLRIGVASEALGRAGTLQVAVHVPKPSESRIQMGGIVIGASDDVATARLGNDDVRSVLPFQPTTNRTFTQAQTLRIFAPVFWRGRETDATVTLTLEGAGVTLRREEQLTVTQPVDGRRVSALDTLIPLDQLSGQFTLTLEAKVREGQTATKSVTFEVQKASGVIGFMAVRP